MSNRAESSLPDLVKAPPAAAPEGSDPSGSRIARTILYSLAVAATVFVCAISWPGFMSLDSIYALRQAREGIVESGYPPAVSYVWWLTERVIPGQGGMFALQNLLVFFGIAKFGLAVRAPMWLAAAVMVVVALAPATLGPMLVVWKDIAFGGFLLLGAGFIVEFRHSRRLRDAVIGLVLVALAATYRLNALPAIVPFLFLLAWRPGDIGGSRRRLLMAALSASLLAVAIIVLSVALSTWRLPDFRRLPPVVGHHGWTMASDLVGVSVCSQVSWLPAPFYPGDSDLAFLRTVYHPEHIHRSFYPYNQTGKLQERGFEQAPDLQRRWLEALRSEPGCFLWHRGNVLVYLLGLNPGRVFYVTDPGVMANDLGVDVDKRKTTGPVVRWVISQADSVFARVWVFVLLGTLACVLAWLARGRSLLASGCYLSGATYLAVGALLLPAADLRYQFWVILAMLMTLLAAFGRPSDQFCPPTEG